MPGRGRGGKSPRACARCPRSARPLGVGGAPQGLVADQGPGYRAAARSSALRAVVRQECTAKSRRPAAVAGTSAVEAEACEDGAAAGLRGRSPGDAGDRHCCRMPATKAGSGLTPGRPSSPPVPLPAPCSQRLKSPVDAGARLRVQSREGDTGLGASSTSASADAPCLGACTACADRLKRSGMNRPWTIRGRSGDEGEVGDSEPAEFGVTGGSRASEAVSKTRRPRDEIGACSTRPRDGDDTAVIACDTKWRQA